VLRGFFRFLDRRGALKNAALAALRTPKLPKSLPRALSIEEAQDTLDEASAIAARAWEGKRNLAILMLLYGGGLRIGEALGLARRAAPAKPGAIAITGIGGKTRLVPILPVVVEAIRDYLAACPHELTPDEKRSLRRQLMRTGGEIIADRFHDHGQDRHEPRLAAFAGDGDRAGLCRSRAARKAERFADAQAAAIEQHQNREVALALPGPRGDGGGFIERVLRLF